MTNIDPLNRESIADMDDSQIAEEVVALLRKVVPHEIGETTLSSLLVEDIGIDSLGSYELMMDAEDRFGIEIAEDELLNLKSIADIVALVRSKNS